MNSLLVASNVVVPLLVLIAVGYMVRAFGWVSQESFTQMNKLVFNVLLPCVLFENVCSVHLGELVNPMQLLFGVGSLVFIFVCSIPLVKALTKDPTKRGVALQAIFRSNFILYGFPIVQSMYSKEQLGTTTILISVIVPVFNVLAVIALEMFRSGKINYAKILLNIAKNPLIIGTVLGLLCSVLLPSGPPQLFMRSLGTLTSSATPLALIILGGTFRPQSLGENRRLLTVMASMKLVVVPGVFLILAILLGFRNVELLAFVALFGSPVAVSSFSMAQQMGGDSELAAQNLLITTVLSILTIFAWVSILNYFSYIV